MNNLNSILIEGNVVRDPEYRTTPKGTAVCNFSIASNRYFRHDNGYEKEVSFFDVETDRWTGNDGKPRSRISIVAEHVEFRPDFKNGSAAEQDNTTDVDTPNYEEAAEPVEAGFAIDF